MVLKYLFTPKKKCLCAATHANPPTLHLSSLCTVIFISSKELSCSSRVSECVLSRYQGNRLSRSWSVSIIQGMDFELRAGFSSSSSLFNFFSTFFFHFPRIFFTLAQRRKDEHKSPGEFHELHRRSYSDGCLTRLHFRAISFAVSLFFILCDTPYPFSTLLTGVGS